MNVLALTIFLGLVMAFLFVFLFLHQRGAGEERDALLPFGEEGTRPTGSGERSKTHKSA